MSTKPTDILQCAIDLTRDTKGVEALCRAAIGRSYYAAFHDCREWRASVHGQAAFSSNPSAGGVHQELATQLMQPPVSLDANAQRLSKERGVALRKLHGDRVIADYRLNQPVSPLHARTALSAAHHIFSLT